MECKYFILHWVYTNFSFHYQIMFHMTVLLLTSSIHLFFTCEARSCHTHHKALHYRRSEVSMAMETRTVVFMVVTLHNLVSGCQWVWGTSVTMYMTTRLTTQKSRIHFINVPPIISIFLYSQNTTNQKKWTRKT